MKLCKDCNHFVKESDLKHEEDKVEYAKCAKAKYSPDPVSGKVNFRSCRLERSYGSIDAFMLSRCGKPGRYFEPKQ